MNAVLNFQASVDEVPAQRITPWERERIRLITTLLHPQRFGPDGHSVVESFNTLLWVLHLRHFTVFSHEGHNLNLPRVMDIRCGSLESFQFMEATLGKDREEDRLGEALAMHGFRGINLYFNHRYYFYPLHPQEGVTTTRLRSSALRDFLVPLFANQTQLITQEHLNDFLRLFHRSERLRHQANQRLWWEDAVDGSLRLEILDHNQPKILAAASRELFPLLQQYPHPEQRLALQDLGLRLFQDRWFTANNSLLPTLLEVLDRSPLLQEQAARFHWHTEKDGLLFRPRSGDERQP